MRMKNVLKNTKSIHARKITLSDRWLGRVNQEDIWRILKMW